MQENIGRHAYQMELSVHRLLALPGRDRRTVVYA
jgi:hypothetical protein